ncbi:MAG TPA: hypothetical protein VGF55_19325 [Gemmataceae bacterium]|jgi:hypothetical protein
MRGWSVLGCGVMQLGLRHDRGGDLETTRWVTVCYLPLLDEVRREQSETQAEPGTAP